MSGSLIIRPLMFVHRLFFSLLSLYPREFTSKVLPLLVKAIFTLKWGTNLELTNSFNSWLPF